MPLFLDILGVMGPVLLAVAAGFTLARARPIALSGLTDALFYLFMPALVFSTMARNTLSAGQLGQVALAACLVSLGSGASGWLLLRARRKHSPGLLLCVMFANNANMGISICNLAFGDEGMALATAYYATTAILTFSVGLAIAAPAASRLEVFKAPLGHAALVGLGVRFLDLPIPEFVHTGAALLGKAAIPTMLVSLGCRLATVRLTSLGLAAQASAARIFGGFALGLAVMLLLGTSGISRSVILLQASMPTAVITFVIAERYDQDPDLVSSTIAISTLASLLTIPALLVWLMG